MPDQNPQHVTFTYEGHLFELVRHQDWGARRMHRTHQLLGLFGGCAVVAPLGSQDESDWNLADIFIRALARYLGGDLGGPYDVYDHDEGVYMDDNDKDEYDTIEEALAACDAFYRDYPISGLDIRDQQGTVVRRWTKKP